MANEIIDESAKYLLLDDKGLIIEQNKEFNDKMVGDICDIIHRSKKISNENEILISIQFEKNNVKNPLVFPEDFLFILHIIISYFFISINCRNY